MFEHYPSRSGSVSASYGGKQLHSSFDPAREAERFLDTELPQIPRVVILIGPGLGHLIPAIAQRSPTSRVIAMFLSAECHGNAVATGEVSWHPGCGVDPAAFLSAGLSELESAAVAVVEWPPAAACFQDEAIGVRNAVSSVVRQHQASLLTEGANGRRWFANLVRNFGSASRLVSPEPAGAKTIRACCIAAAGPSLETALSAIAPFRSEISLWVLGSALDPVLARGLEPDLLISTDAAVYAMEYLRKAIAPETTMCPVAAPLTASRGIGDEVEIWPLSQGDPVESMLYGELSAAPIQVPAHGTVAGTAIQLAVSLQEWPVVIAGMDLAWHKMQSHARPHVAQVYRDLAGGRLSPPVAAAYGQIREMTRLADGWSTNAALQVYSRWFERAASSPGNRIFSLAPSPAMHGLHEVTPEWIGTLPREFRAPVFAPAPWPAPERRAQLLLSVVDRCRAAIAPLTDSTDVGQLDPLQEFLLRRFALESLLGWIRSDSRSCIMDAAEATERELVRIGESI